MPLIPYLIGRFQHDHENRLFAELVRTLDGAFARTESPSILIGNLMVEGNDLDALLVKPNGICVLEMKSHSGKLQFFENLPWVVGDAQVVGGSKPNPFLQVRAYRIGVRNFLSNWQANILRQPRPIAWNHVSARVIFRGPVEFNGQHLGATLRRWFGITDLLNAADELYSIDTPSLRLQPEEVLRIPGVLGLSSEQRYHGPEADIPTPPTTLGEINPRAGASGRSRLVYFKEFNFREGEERFRLRGGVPAQAAQRMREIFERIRQGEDALDGLVATPDGRVKGAVRYALLQNCELLTLHVGPHVYPVMVGFRIDVDHWLEAHQDLVLVVNAETSRIESTHVSGRMPSITDLAPPALSSETKPFLARIPGLNLEDFLLPRLARQHLLDLDESATEEDIAAALELVPAEDLRALIFDLVNHVRAGDLAAAVARLNLRNGAALPIEDAGAFADEALSSQANSDQALIINDLTKEELDRLLDPTRFQDWMLFLHPDQRRFAELDSERPLVLTGVSGSGKTCILVHRARDLARRHPGQRIGIMTLSRPLARLLQNLVDRLCSEDERQCIVVVPVYEHLRECVKHLGIERFCDQLIESLPPESNLVRELERIRAQWPNGMVWDVDPINRDHVDEQWHEFYMTRNPDVLEWLTPITSNLEEARVDASRYLEEEFTLIRSSFPIPTRVAGYLDMERTGRMHQFRSSIRQDVLRLVSFWEEWLLAGGMIDTLGLTLALLPMYQEMQRLPENLRFRCLLVDEYQDLSTLDFQVLRRLVNLSQPNALFLAGDPVQRILVKKLRLGEVGLEQGPAKHESLRKNYRNSRQILRAAATVANHFGAIAKSQGEEIEVLDPELAQRETSPPVLIKTDREIEKAWEIVLECIEADVSERWTICVVTVAPTKLRIEDILAARPADLPARALSGDCILNPNEVVVGSITDLKGFEFRLVILLGCSADLFPDGGVPSGEIWRDALRLYVAMTRGRDQVFLLHEGEPSPFIQVMGDTVVSREEPVMRPYTRAQPAIASSPAPTTTESQPPTLGVDPDENCEGLLTPANLEVLKRFYAQRVHRENLTFHQWCTPRNLASITRDQLLRTRRMPPQSALDTLRKLEDLGITRARFEALRARALRHCRAEGCNARPIPGEDLCYEHKSE